MPFSTQQFSLSFLPSFFSLPTFTSIWSFRSFRFGTVIESKVFQAWHVLISMILSFILITAKKTRKSSQIDIENSPLIKAPVEASAVVRVHVHHMRAEHKEESEIISLESRHCWLVQRTPIGVVNFATRSLLVWVLQRARGSRRARPCAAAPVWGNGVTSATAHITRERAHSQVNSAVLLHFAQFLRRLWYLYVEGLGERFFVLALSLHRRRTRKSWQKSHWHTFSILLVHVEPELGGTVKFKFHNRERVDDLNCTSSPSWGRMMWMEIMTLLFALHYGNPGSSRRNFRFQLSWIFKCVSRLFQLIDNGAVARTKSKVKLESDKSTVISCARELTNRKRTRLDECKSVECWMSYTNFIFGYMQIEQFCLCCAHSIEFWSEQFFVFQHRRVKVLQQQDVGKTTNNERKKWERKKIYKKFIELM